MGEKDYACALQKYQAVAQLQPTNLDVQSLLKCATIRQQQVQYQSLSADLRQCLSIQKDLQCSFSTRQKARNIGLDKSAI